jgi:hypothetical protein
MKIILNNLQTPASKPQGYLLSNCKLDREEGGENR